VRERLLNSFKILTWNACGVSIEDIHTIVLQLPSFDVLNIQEVLVPPQCQKRDPWSVSLPSGHTVWCTALQAGRCIATVLSRDMAASVWTSVAGPRWLRVGVTCSDVRILMYNVHLVPSDGSPEREELYFFAF